MSTNDISRYLVKANGSSFTSDNELQSLAVNSKVTNINSGLTYKKTALNVYDKTPIEVETDAVLYSPQTLTDAQKLQARTNIGVSDLSGVPLGTIVIWSGDASSIPDGWHICDGNEGTPDLSQKFVLGAGGIYPLNSSGGSVDHFHFFGRHTGDNSGSFYVCGELHNDSEGTNTAQLVKSPRKEALLSALNFGTSSAVIIKDEIGPKTAMWNGDSGGGISDHDKFTRGNMITSRGYAAGVTAAETDCMPPYYVLYYIMKITGNGSTSSGGTAASATQVENLSNLISQLQARIAALESSGTGSGSGGGTFTLGNEFTATIVSIGKPTDPIPVGTIITPNMYHQGDGSSYGGSSQTPGRWKIYQGTDTGSSASLLSSGSYIVTQQSTVSSTSESSGGVPYGEYHHTLKLRKITGVNV